MEACWVYLRHKFGADVSSLEFGIGDDVAQERNVVLWPYVSNSQGIDHHELVMSLPRMTYESSDLTMRSRAAFRF